MDIEENAALFAKLAELKNKNLEVLLEKVWKKALEGTDIRFVILALNLAGVPTRAGNLQPERPETEVKTTRLRLGDGVDEYIDL